MKNSDKKFHEVARPVLTESKVTALLFWSVFWKVTASVSLLLCVGFFTLQYHDDSSGPFLQTAFGSLVIIGYCAITAFWVGIGAACFAIVWRWFGAWVLAPIGGTVLGAVAGVSLVLLMLSGTNIPSSGPHGGGEAAALLVFAFLGVAAAVGGICGGIVSGAAAVCGAMIARRRKRTLQSTQRERGEGDD